MNTLEQDLIRTLEISYTQLMTVADDCSKTMTMLNNRRKVLAYEIQQLNDFGDTTQQEKIAGLKIEKVAIKEALDRKTKELKEINDNMQLAMMHVNFQKDCVQLWDKEGFYKTFLAETGLSTREALLQEQEYVLPSEDINFLIISVIPDYIRVGRQDIADLLNALKEPAQHVRIFELVKKEYTQNPDYNYGFVLSLCLDNGWGTIKDEHAALVIDKQFAALNHPLALLSVASEYENEDKVVADKKEAIELYQRAVVPEQQSFYIVHALWGNKLLKGDGIEKDETQALHFLNIAHEKGCFLAALYLMLYLHEKAKELKTSFKTVGENQNVSEATITSFQTQIRDVEEQIFFYAKKLNETGLIIGKDSLATCYYNGCGVATDLQQYFKLVNECAAMGHANSIADLARDHQYGLPGILEPDPIRALTLYAECLRKNRINILEDFKTLISGNIKSIEFMTLVYDFCKKCLQGHLLDNGLDSTVIGLFYQHGILMPKNIEKAILCLRKGADLGVSEAATALVKLSMHKENAGLIPISLAHKYFSDAYDDEIVEVRLHYQKNYLPLLQVLKQTWPTIGLGATFSIPDGVTRLIADYADNALEKQEKAVFELQF